MYRCQIVNGVSVSLPSQRQSPSPDPTVGIVVSWRAEFDVLICVAIRNRKDLLYAFIEPLGKSSQVLGGVEFGMLQLIWLLVERSVHDGVFEHTFDHRCCSHCNEFSTLDQT